jgi:biopolymer transport protein ExbD
VAGQTYTPQSLAELLAIEQAKEGGDDLTVVIRGDRDAPWDTVREIMQVCASRQIHRVRVSVLESEGLE